MSTTPTAGTSMIRIATLFLALALGGCAAFQTKAQNFSSDLVGAVRETQPELFEIERQLADSAATFVGRAIGDKVLGPASGVWDTMLLKMNDQSKVVMTHIGEGIERDLNRSLQVTLSENLKLAREGSALLMDSTFAHAQTQIQPLVDATMLSLANGLRRDLQPVISDVIRKSSDQLIDRIAVLDSTLAESKAGRKAAGVLYVVIGGLVVMVIGGGIVWRRNTVRTREAFRIANEALKTAAPFQGEKLKQELHNKGLHQQADWLK